MIKWLEGNPVGATLASVCAGLLVISLLLGVVWSLPPSAPEAESGDEDEALALNIPELEDSEPLEAYSVITERPVFNVTRLPVLDDEAADGEGDDLLADEDVDAPEVELAGVIITPSIKMVTLRSNERPESLVAFEGQPLEGDYGSWQVSHIAAREITLSSDSGEELVLKLQVHDATIEAPPKIETEAKDERTPADAGAGDQEDDQPLTRAEEIRQRIAERREELRRAAEQEGQDQDEASEAKQDYRSAIQSMISGSRQKEKPDENER